MNAYSGQFSVVTVPVFTFTSPISGDYNYNEDLEVTWTHVDGGANIQLDYSHDDGNNWVQIEATTPNDLSYTISSGIINITNQGKLRITNIDSGHQYISDTFRMINPALYLTYPLGGEILEPGPIDIGWAGDLDDSPDTVNIYYDDGGGWTLIAADQPVAGTYQWDPGFTTGTKIKVEATDGSVSAETDGDGFYVPTTGAYFLNPPTPTSTFIGMDIALRTLGVSFDQSTLGNTPSNTPKTLEVILETLNGHEIYSANFDIALAGGGDIKSFHTKVLELIFNAQYEIKTLQKGTYNVIYRMWSENPHLLDQWIASLVVPFTPADIASYTYSGGLGVYDLTNAVLPMHKEHLFQTIHVQTSDNAIIKSSCFRENPVPTPPPSKIII